MDAFKGRGGGSVLLVCELVYVIELQSHQPTCRIM